MVLIVIGLTKSLPECQSNKQIFSSVILDYNIIPRDGSAHNTVDNNSKVLRIHKRLKLEL